MDLYTSIGDARISSYPINPFAIPSEMVFAINVGLSCLSDDHLKFQSVLNALKVFSPKNSCEHRQRLSEFGPPRTLLASVPNN